MDSLKSLYFGDPKSNAFDTQKLKAEIDSAFNVIEEFLNLRYELTSQGIHITCHNCAKKQKIQNPKNALYVATQRDTSASLKYSSHSYKVNHSRESQSDSSVDRSQHKVGRSNQVHALNFPVQREGDDSDDDAKTDRTSDKIDKDKQLLNDKLTEKEKCLREAKEENSELQKQLKEFLRKYDRDLHNAGIEQSRLTEERDRSEKSIKEIESKLNQLEFEVSDLKEELDKKKQECQHHQSCLENDKRTHETILSQMITEQDNLRSQLHEARALIETLRSRKSELSKRCDEKEEEISLLKKKIKESQTDNESKTEQIDNNKRILDTLLCHMNTKQDYLRSQLKETRALIETDQSELSKRCDEKEEEITTLKGKIQELNAELSAFTERARKTLVINFHTTLTQSLALPAKQHIVRCLKEKCKSDDITLEVKQYKSPDETPGPILVLCMNVSTLRTDVKDALKGTPENFEVIVVVLHHREIHALPVQASDRLLTGEGYKQLGAIVDAAFWTGKGMYDCELNNLAVEKIYSFVSGFVPK